MNQYELEFKAKHLYEYCKHLYSKQEIMEACAFMDAKLPPDMKHDTYNLVQTAIDFAVTRDKPFDATVCILVIALLYEPLEHSIHQQCNEKARLPAENSQSLNNGGSSKPGYQEVDLRLTEVSVCPSSLPSRTPGGNAT